MKNISANLTLVQLMDSLGNVNHAISVVGSWIFDSNYEIALVLNKESLDMIYVPSVGYTTLFRSELQNLQTKT